MAVLYQNEATFNGFEQSATRGGSLARIYTKETGSNGKIHGAYWDGSNWHAVAWQRHGYYNPYNAETKEQVTCALDLVTATPIGDY